MDYRRDPLLVAVDRALKWTMERALTKTLADKCKVSVSAVYLSWLVY